MENKSINVVMNDTRKAVLKVLGEAKEAMTLAEISDKAGLSVKSGSTNSMVKAGLIKKSGTKKVAKVVYVEVDTYEIA